MVAAVGPGLFGPGTITSWASARRSTGNGDDEGDGQKGPAADQMPSARGA